MNIKEKSLVMSFVERLAMRERVAGKTAAYKKVNEKPFVNNVMFVGILLLETEQLTCRSTCSKIRIENTEKMFWLL